MVKEMYQKMTYINIDVYNLNIFEVYFYVMSNQNKSHES